MSDTEAEALPTTTVEPQAAASTSKPKPVKTPVIQTSKVAITAKTSAAAKHNNAKINAPIVKPVANRTVYTKWRAYEDKVHKQNKANAKAVVETRLEKSFLAKLSSNKCKKPQVDLGRQFEIQLENRSLLQRLQKISKRADEKKSKKAGGVQVSAQQEKDMVEDKPSGDAQAVELGEVP